MAGDKDDSVPTGVNQISYHGPDDANVPKLVITYYSSVYPTSDSGRVGSLVHMYDRRQGIFNLEITFGGIGYTSPSTVGSFGSSGMSAGDVPTLAELDPPPRPLSEPPKRTLRDIPSTPFIDLQGATYYARARAQELFELGFIDSSGVPTAKGIAWARANPTEAAPRRYTAERGQVEDRLRYLRAEMLEFKRRTGRAPRVTGATSLMRGDWPYTPVSAALWQVGRMREQVAGLGRSRTELEAAGREQYPAIKTPYSGFIGRLRAAASRRGPTIRHLRGEAWRERRERMMR